jgi:hypothetical protein
MRCPEFREVMRSFIDGEVDSDTRREIGLHLAECTDCAKLIEDDRFWNETVLGYLDHELPAGLRESILGDLDDLGWRQQLRIGWWAILRDLSRPKGMLQAAAVAVVLILALNYLPFFRSADKPVGGDEAFRHSGPIVQVGREVDWKPGETVPTARLSLSGRLI